MKYVILLPLCWLLLSVAAAAQGVCIGCNAGTMSIQGGSGGYDPSAPRRSSAVADDVSYCRGGAPYCLVANSTQRRLSLFHNGTGVVGWDVIMLPPGRVMRGYIAQIIHDPSWCPTASVRRKFPGLPAGCLGPGHPQNAMGDLKITMSGDFAGTAIRIHDTQGFGPQWTNEDSSGCVRVLNLRSELLPRINGGKSRVEVVFH